MSNKKKLQSIIVLFAQILKINRKKHQLNVKITKVYTKFKDIQLIEVYHISNWQSVNVLLCILIIDIFIWSAIVCKCEHFHPIS